MMRIMTWRQNNPAPQGTAPNAGIAAFNELAGAASKVRGAGNVYWGFGNGGIVTVSLYDDYAVADSILKDPAVQAAVAKILALGVGIADDNFVTTPQQVAPFLPHQ